MGRLVDLRWESRTEPGSSCKTSSHFILDSGGTDRALGIESDVPFQELELIAFKN